MSDACIGPQRAGTIGTGYMIKIDFEKSVNGGKLIEKNLERVARINRNNFFWKRMGTDIKNATQ